MKKNKLALALATLLASGAAWSHGFVLEPPARALLCNKISEYNHNYNGQKNANCGSIQWEPQSTEAPKGFPAAGVKDRQIASANRVRGPELDAQSATRWVKTPLSPGYNEFKWHFTANHPATKFEYFITKNDWNPNQKLTRASFESKPFCTVEAGGVMTSGSAVHTCNVPAHTGYQVILAVWTVHDTSNAFYSAIDVDMGGHNSGGEDTNDKPDDGGNKPDDGGNKPDNGNDNNKPDNGGEEVQQKPVIKLAQQHFVVDQSAQSMSLAIDASATQHATRYKWEVISGYDTFQLQKKSGAATSNVLKGKSLSKVHAWVKANGTGKATYRLTVTGADKSKVSKDITVEVKAKDNGNDNTGNADAPAWSASKTYSKACEKVSRGGSIWQSQHWVDAGTDPLKSANYWGQPWQRVGSKYNNCK